jgi:purine-cytosine permease-like protein
MSQVVDRPAIEQAQAAEEYPLSAVPRHVRKPVWSLAPLLMGFALTSSTLFAEGTLGPAFKLWPDLLSIILIGNLILGVYCAALGYIAYRSGLTTVLMARFSFGNVGSRWVDFIMGFTQIGWYAFTTAIVVQILNELLGWPTSLNWLLILFFTYAFCVTAYVGYQAMDWLSRLAVPAMLVLIAISLVLAFGDAQSVQAVRPSGELTYGAALALTIGTFISGGTQATNWSRFADSGKNAIFQYPGGLLFNQRLTRICGCVLHHRLRQRRFSAGYGDPGHSGGGSCLAHPQCLDDTGQYDLCLCGSRGQYVSHQAASCLCDWRRNRSAGAVALGYLRLVGELPRVPRHCDSAGRGHYHGRFLVEASQ